MTPEQLLEETIRPAVENAPTARAVDPSAYFEDDGSLLRCPGCGALPSDCNCTS